MSSSLEAVTVSGGEDWRSCLFLPCISPCDPLSLPSPLPGNQAHIGADPGPCLPHILGRANSLEELGSLELPSSSSKPS